MIAKIVAILGATNAGLVLQTTLSICAVFFISYVLVFLLTSRSYRKIVVDVYKRQCTCLRKRRVTITSQTI